MKKTWLLLAVLLGLLLTGCAEHTAEAGGISGIYQNTDWVLNSADGRCEKTILILQENGRFLLRSCTFQLRPEKARRETAWEGRYDLKGSVLTLYCGGRECQLLYLDGKIYWNTLEKRQEGDSVS